jgi:hypothetical protein
MDGKEGAGGEKWRRPRLYREKKAERGPADPKIWFPANTPQIEFEGPAICVALYL